jgi:hypothetical protein
LINPDGRPSKALLHARLVAQPPLESRAEVQASANRAQVLPFQASTAGQVSAGVRRSGPGERTIGASPPSSRGAGPKPQAETDVGRRVASSSEVPAEVAGRESGGRLLMRAAGWTIRVETPVDLPAGARVQLVLPAGTSLPQPASAPVAPPAPRHTSAASRPAGESPVAQEHRTPAAEPASAARLLQAIQSARPDPSRRLRPGEAVPDRTAAAAASSAGETGTEPFRQSQAGGWRLMLLPFGAGPAEVLRLYLGEDPSEGHGGASEAGPETPRRAVFDLDLGHLGHCQLDVFCPARRFDLIVRSERILAAPLQSEIRALHQAVLDATGWSGAIGFRPELLAMPGPEQPLGTPVTA